MSTLWKSALALTIFIGFGACAEMQFGKISNCQNSGFTCQVVCYDEDNCVEEFSPMVSVPEAQVDILFVIDNSGSMSIDQKNLSDNFNGLFDKIQELDYRIAITTTDVSASEFSLFHARLEPPYSKAGKPEGATRGSLGGYYQDGRFLPFSISGTHNYLHKGLGSPADVEAAFKATLDRITQGTEFCEDNRFKQEYCASGDERGIYAMNLALENNRSSGFFRPLAHLAVVVVSDEDERSNGIFSPGCDPHTQLGCLDYLDRPESFLEKLMHLHPRKTVAVHSIVTDSSQCARAQQAQYRLPGGQNAGAGIIGHQYRRLSDMTGGVKGSVCAPNYTAQLGEIGSTVLELISTVPLACRPIGDHVVVEFEGPAPNVQVIIEAEQRRVRFEPALPPGTKMKLHYDCNY